MSYLLLLKSTLAVLVDCSRDKWDGLEEGRQPEWSAAYLEEPLDNETHLALVCEPFWILSLDIAAVSGGTFSFPGPFPAISAQISESALLLRVKTRATK